MSEQFQLYLFTMPSSLDLSITIGGTQVALVPIEVPGERVKALTSAYSLVKELRFSQNEYQRMLLRRKNKIVEDDEEGAEDLALHLGQTREEKAEELKREAEEAAIQHEEEKL